MVIIKKLVSFLRQKNWIAGGGKNSVAIIPQFKEHTFKLNYKTSHYPKLFLMNASRKDWLTFFFFFLSLTKPLNILQIGFRICLSTNTMNGNSKHDNSMAQNHQTKTLMSNNRGQSRYTNSHARFYGSLRFNCSHVPRGGGAEASVCPAVI